jgi:hypothetical protein
MILTLVVVVALGTTAAGCASPAEAPVLGEFFHASRLRDRTALQKLGTVFFDPAVDGIVTAFEITRVTPRQDGGRRLKDVTIAAPVKLWSGQVVRKNLVVTMESAGGRWMVTAITDAPAAPSSPPS